VLVAFLLALCASGCAWGRKKEQATTPQAMYEDAMKLFQRKKYERAAQAFKKFKEEFPLSELTPMVELRTADSYFFDKNYSEAVVLYEEFKKLHPLHPEIPYSIYQLGMCHFKQMYSLDRDQTETEKAIEQFRYLIENFPPSPHVPEAKTKMKICQKQLADHEFYVGNFYLRMKKYKGALARFEAILQKFPESGLEEKVKRLAETCRVEVAKEEEKRKSEEAREEREKKEREEKKKATGAGLPSPS
jgi:outer membrane protein assembly factor BamD